jgi:Trp operon repressor
MKCITPYPIYLSSFLYRASISPFICFLFIVISAFLLTLAPTSKAIANTRPTILNVIEKNLVVDGKPSKVFDIVQPNGVFGYVGTKNGLFDVIVKNKTRVPLVLHWHGIVGPNDQDGVPYVTQLPIAPGKSYHYQFKLNQAGTFWLHSHYKLQEQKLMAAPLIIHNPTEPKEHEVLMFIQDFTFANPASVYENLKTKYQKMMVKQTKKVANDDDRMKKSMNGPNKNKDRDVSDVKFDAYLTNHRTLKDPEIVRVRPHETVRLRIINASSSTNYYIDLGRLTGTLFAIDGEQIKPITDSRFQIAIGNRLDIRIKLPDGENAYPILALPEGVKAQTGLILATANAKILNLPESTKSANPILNALLPNDLSSISKGHIMNEAGWRHFLKLCLSNKNEKNLSLMFDLFLTPEEKENLSLRCLIIEELIKQKKTQRDIAETLQVSIAKITRGSNELKRMPSTLIDFLKENIK